MAISKTKKIFIIAIVLRITILFISRFHADLYNHIDWGNKFLSMNPKKFYENIFWDLSWPNQPPASILLFGLIAFIKNTIFSFVLTLNYKFPVFPSFVVPVLEKNLHVWMLKLPFIISDVIIGKVIYDFVKKHKPNKALICASLWLFNPATIYNSTVWGQTDSLINLFALISIIGLCEKKYTKSIVFLFLSLFFKISLLIYIPLYFFFILKNISRKTIKSVLVGLLISFTIFYAHNWPFKVRSKNIYTWTIYIYRDKVFLRQQKFLSANAYNFWNIIFDQNTTLQPDISISGVNSSTIGWIVGIVLILFISYRLYTKNINIFSAFMLCAFTSFMFLPNMHERYLYPFFPIATIIVGLTKLLNPKQYIFMAIIHLFNLYNWWCYPNIEPIRFIFDFSTPIYTRFFSMILLYIFIRLYVKFVKSETQKI